MVGAMSEPKSKGPAQPDGSKQRGARRFRERPAGRGHRSRPDRPQWGPRGPHCLGGFARAGQALSLVDGSALRAWLSV
jgi:hypothetical protein